MTVQESDDYRQVLVKKYRRILIDRLTEKDLFDLKDLLKHKFRPDRTMDPVVRSRFESRLRDFLHEEILTREMASLEELIDRLRPEDLRKPAE